MKTNLKAVDPMEKHIAEVITDHGLDKISSNVIGGCVDSVGNDLQRIGSIEDKITGLILNILPRLCIVKNTLHRVIEEGGKIEYDELSCIDILSNEAYHLLRAVHSLDGLK